MQKSQRLAEKQPLPGRPREVGRVGLPGRGQITHLTPARPPLAHLLRGTGGSWAAAGSTGGTAGPGPPGSCHRSHPGLPPPRSWWRFSEPGVTSLGVSAQERRRLETAEMFIEWQPGSLEEQIFRRRKRGVAKSLHTSLQLTVSGLCTPQPLRLPGMD